MGLLNIKTLLTLRDSIRAIKDLYPDRINMEAGKMSHGSTCLCRMVKNKKKVIIMLSHGDFKTFRSFA